MAIARVSLAGLLRFFFFFLIFYVSFKPETPGLTISSKPSQQEFARTQTLLKPITARLRKRGRRFHQIRAPRIRKPRVEMAVGGLDHGAL